MTNTGTLPIEPGPRVEDILLPKKVLVILVLGAAFGASATVASVIAATKGTQQQEDLRKNQQILTSICEDSRALARKFAGSSAPPCPTAAP